MLKGCEYFLNFLVISALLSLQVVSCIFQEQMEVLKNNKQYKGDNHTYGAHSLHNGSFVGFTAWKQSRQEYDDGDIIVFDGITLNEGGHYDTRSNRFTCPIEGIYFLSVTARGDDLIDRTDFDIIVEGQLIYDLFNQNTFTGTSYNPFNIVTNSGLFPCTQNQRVWVQADGSGVASGEPGIPYTSFTVFLMLQKDLMHDSFVGFSARKTTLQSYVSGETILYDETVINEGGVFVPEVSRFYCPVSGIYYTTVNTYSNECPSSIGVNAGVTMNSLFFLHSRLNPENCWSSVSHSRLFRCTEGDFVAVQGLEEGYAEGGDNFLLTTFTTFLMFADQTGKEHSAFVGFSAFKQSNQTYEIGDTIAFDGVLLNEGGGYQPLFGRFICPANGIYYVAVTVTRQGVEDLLIDVEYETDVLFRLSSTESENPYNAISNSALVRCFNGEEISVKAAGSGSVLGDGSETLSIFTVMKMFEY